MIIVHLILLNTGRFQPEKSYLETLELNFRKDVKNDWHFYGVFLDE